MHAYVTQFAKAAKAAAAKAARQGASGDGENAETSRDIEKRILGDKFIRKDAYGADRFEDYFSDSSMSVCLPDDGLDDTEKRAQKRRKKIVIPDYTAWSSSLDSASRGSSAVAAGSSGASVRADSVSHAGAGDAENALPSLNVEQATPRRISGTHDKAARQGNATFIRPRAIVPPEPNTREDLASRPIEPVRLSDAFEQMLPPTARSLETAPVNSQPSVAKTPELRSPSGEHATQRQPQQQQQNQRSLQPPAFSPQESPNFELHSRQRPMVPAGVPAATAASEEESQSPELTPITPAGATLRLLHGRSVSSEFDANAEPCFSSVRVYTMPAAKRSRRCHAAESTRLSVAGFELPQIPPATVTARRTSPLWQPERTCIVAAHATPAMRLSPRPLGQSVVQPTTTTSRRRSSSQSGGGSSRRTSASARSDSVESSRCATVGSESLGTGSYTSSRCGLDADHGVASRMPVALGAAQVAPDTPRASAGMPKLHVGDKLHPILETSQQLAKDAGFTDTESEAECRAPSTPRIPMDRTPAAGGTAASSSSKAPPLSGRSGRGDAERTPATAAATDAGRHRSSPSSVGGKQKVTADRLAARRHSAGGSSSLSRRVRVRSSPYSVPSGDSEGIVDYQALVPDFLPPPEFASDETQGAASANRTDNRRLSSLRRAAPAALTMHDMPMSAERACGGSGAPVDSDPEDRRTFSRRSRGRPRDGGTTSGTPSIELGSGGRHRHSTVASSNRVDGEAAASNDMPLDYGATRLSQARASRVAASVAESAPPTGRGRSSEGASSERLTDPNRSQSAKRREPASSASGSVASAKPAASSCVSASSLLESQRASVASSLRTSKRLYTPACAHLEAADDAGNSTGDDERATGPACDSPTASPAGRKRIVRGGSADARCSNVDASEAHAASRTSSRRPAIKNFGRQSAKAGSSRVARSPTKRKRVGKRLSWASTAGSAVDDRDSNMPRHAAAAAGRKAANAGVSAVESVLSVSASPVHYHEMTHTSPGVQVLGAGVRRRVKVVVPEEDAADGLRRSKRVRVQTLRWDLGERIEYAPGLGGFLGLCLRNDLIALEAKEKAAAAKRRMRPEDKQRARVPRKRNDLAERDISVLDETPVAEEPTVDGDITIVNPSTNALEPQECVFPWKRQKCWRPEEPDGSNAKYEYSDVFAKSDLFRVGQIELEANGFKAESRSDLDLVFTVCSGRIELVLGQSTRRLSSRDTLWIPKGNPYSLKNLSSRKTAVLGVVQVDLGLYPDDSARGTASDSDGHSYGDSARTAVSDTA